MSEQSAEQSQAQLSGRELWLAVAKALGWEMDERYIWRTDLPGVATAVQWGSWNAAGMVLERMQELGRDGELWSNPARLRPWSARFENADGQLLFRDWRYGDTGPDAIARAALVTKEGGT